MQATYSVLLISAATLGIVHTAIGVDHYVPFIALGRERRWGAGKAAGIAALCGLGHVASSALLAALGIAAGAAAGQLSWFEAFRGQMVSWLIIAMGAAYLGLGLWRAASRRFGAGLSEKAAQGGRVIAPLAVALLALGPCEALLPLMTTAGGLLPLGALLGVVTLFALTTLGTMMLLVSGGILGVSWVQERWPSVAALVPSGPVMVGTSLMASGLAVQWLGV
jgi:nickel/cobalt transporter (NicO) family protein